MKTLLKLALAALAAVVLCGPSPVNGAKELGSLASKRCSEWSAFAKEARASLHEARLKASRRLARK